MSTLFAIALGALVVAIPVACLARSVLLEQLAAFCSFAGCVLLVIVGLDAALSDHQLVVNLGSWLGFGHSALRADGLSGIFLALTGITGAAVSLAYAEIPTGCWLTILNASLILFITVAIGSDNGFLFFLSWEAISVCVYLIASAGSAREELLGGYLTGGLAKLGGAALLAAFALLYAHTHSFSLEAWRHAQLSGGTRDLLFALFLACFATKVGVLPLQGGLPAGYGSAPRLGAASLSVALCAGFYGLWRFEFDVLGPLPTGCGDALLIIAAVTAVTGITYALIQDDLRKFLGYSTVEHAGIALVGLAVALLGHTTHQPKLAAIGLLAATLHVCAHNLSKTLALINVDRLGTATGDKTLDELGGLSEWLPRTAASLGVASLTLAAIPPLGGFVSEWFTFEALLQSFRMPTLLSKLLCALAAAILALTAGLGLLAFAKYYSFMFLGRTRGIFQAIIEPSRWGLAPGALGLIVLFLGAAAPWEIHILGSGLQPLLELNAASTTITHPLVLGPVFQNFSTLDPTWLCVVLPAYAIIAALIAFGADRRRRVRRAPVWVTGSGAPLAAVQYRPSAYSNPMRVILRGPLGFRSRLILAEDGGASARWTLDTRVVLVVDRFVYKPASQCALRIAALVRATQSGRLSAYLLYMLVALIVALSLVPILR